jgi:phospholipase/lecithinase/hemolysin
MGDAAPHHDARLVISSETSPSIFLFNKGKTMSIRRAVSAACVALIAIVSATSAQAYDQVIVFGDSLSDNGNLAAKFGGAVPAAPYFNGRFSNGPVAVEVLATQLGLPLVDYAYGGAQTGTDNMFQSQNPLVANTGMKAQVTNFTSQLASSGTSADSSALYVVWGGGNDLLSTLSTPTASVINAALTTAVTNLVTEVGTLYAAGARDFLIPLLPDLATSYYGTSGMVPTSFLSNLSNAFNGALTTQLNGLKTTRSDLNLNIFNTPSVLTGVRAEITANGGNLTDPCWTGDYSGAGNTAPLCADPSKYALFDKVHPTAVVHDALGKAMAVSVTAVPEPMTSGLMLVGLVFTGLAVRRQRAA